jgi:hypothetical protein
VNIRSVDEAVVIGAALSLSSSAFVLQVCKQYFNFLCLLFFHLPFSLQDNNEFVEVRENYDMPSMKSDL